MIDEAANSCARLVALIAELSEISKIDSNSAPATHDTFGLFTDLDHVAVNVPNEDGREVRLQLGGMAAGATLTGDRLQLRAACGAFLGR